MEEYPVTIGIEHKERLSRLTTFFRYFMAMPHYICLYGIGIAASVIVFISWWAILFTAKVSCVGIRVRQRLLSLVYKGKWLLSLANG